MTAKRKIMIGIIVAMLACAIVLVIGDLGKHAPKATAVSSVNATVLSTGITVNVIGTRMSCELVTDWQQERKGNLIVVTPIFTRLEDAACDPLVPFEEAVPIQVGDIPAGGYQIDVLGTVVVAQVTVPIVAFDFKELTDATFQRFPIQMSLSAGLTDPDTSSVAEPTATAIRKAWQTTSVDFADRLEIVAVPCPETGAACQMQYVFDRLTGKLAHVFTSDFGIRIQEGSALVIINDPERIKREGADQPIASEAYVFNPETRQFDFIARGNYLSGERN